MAVTIHSAINCLSNKIHRVNWLLNRISRGYLLHGEVLPCLVFQQG